MYSNQLYKKVKKISMKRIAILSSVNIKHMSMISLYTNLMQQRGIEYDIIYMDKYGEDEFFECAHKYRYTCVVQQNLPRLVKEIKYMSFAPYAKHKLRDGNYDFVIVWNDVAIFQFGSFLVKHFKGRYCLNVRDNMRYDDPRFAWRYKRCFANSAFNTISSEGYLDFLPKNAEYLPIHSLNLSVLEGMQIHNSLRKEGETIRIGFVGYVRFYERNKKLLDVFANDSRFELHYYGKNASVLQAYAQEKGIHNACFHDSFPVEETSKYLERIDVMNNLYGNDTVNVRKAISIKTFHALYARIPMLVYPDTFNALYAEKAGIGFVLGDDEIGEALPDRLFTWYRSLDFEQMSAGCEVYLKKANEENQHFLEVAESYLQ